ncbi:MAG: thrombospondin type 3 repeat-containing protein [Deltaproteobacteria bacterium]|nr:thrombospondin type 3 repeat-containing protein [Deltaproteobacteria bacterium]
MNARAMTMVMSMSLAMASVADAAGEGECSSGFCGTPRDVGGAGGAPCTEGDCSGGGGSILIANTDMGETYSTSDDFDNDGFEDDFDNCPFVANRDQMDGDGDAIGSACDNAPAIANPGQDDIDGDGFGDVADDDKDADGFLNSADNCPSLYNPTQRKTLEGSALGDACNSDDDADGIADASDSCPKLAGVTSGADCDGDEDLDGIPDAADNCPAVANAARDDRDRDGLGDACDTDLDGDGVANIRDNAPEVQNPDQLDLDRDGRGDADDPELCYVFDPASPGDCLNPLDTFKVRALALRTGLEVGQPMSFVLLANRLDTRLSYSFRVERRPDGAENAIGLAKGIVTASRRGFSATDGGFEYSFDGARPSLVPDAPGEWVITVAAELAAPDSVYPGSSRVSSHSIAVTVSGTEDTSGCNSTNSSANLLVLALVGLLIGGRRSFRP